MALTNVVRQLASLAGSSSSSSSSALVSAAAPAAAVVLGLSRSFATQEPGFSRKDVVYNLDNTSDPEAAAAIKAFQRQQFAAAAKGAAAAGPEEPEYELASQIERKYAAAQVVESGIQVGADVCARLCVFVFVCDISGGVGGTDGRGMG